MSSVDASSPVHLVNIARNNPSPTIGTRIKNLLFGRVFANWKESIIVAGVVFWVAKAALSFFTGSWMMAMAEFFTGGFLAMMRNELRDFTNLHKAAGNFHKENTDFRLSNLELKRNIEAFRKEVGLLTHERKRIAAENDRFAKNNRFYETQIGVMKGTLKRAIGEIDEASARGKRVSSQILKTALEAFEQKEQALTQIARDLDARNKAALRQWDQLAGQVSKMSIHGVQALNEAKAALEAVRADIRAHRATKATLEDQIRRLQVQIRGLEERCQELAQATAKIDRAADRNLKAAGIVNNFFGRFCSESSRGESLGSMVTGLLIAGFIATRAFPSVVASAA